MPSYEGSGDKVANRGSFVFDPRLPAHRDVPDHYALKPALGDFISPMSSTRGCKRERSPDDSNLELPQASRLPSKRARTNVSEDGEIAEEETESPGRYFALKDAEYPAAVKEKSLDETYSLREDRVDSVPQQSRGSLQTSNCRPQPPSHRTYVFKAYISAGATAGSKWVTDTAATAAQLEIFA
ncbi:hypothetical protein KC330_g991 [Hortaea werneckii]|nr:hypothetical protein KC330_g991 [Hortaea werneckii]